ncbi:MAG: tetratricopeptide repeat protein [Chitinivibrionales bacterium]|nr:tetratricopeptide repeat protein [Chitinivibrionales bacterium]
MGTPRQTSILEKRMKQFHATLKAGLLSMLMVFSLNAQSIEDLMSSGVELLNNGAYGQAVTRFKKVVARDPGNFEARFNLAFAYLYWGRYADALAELKQAAAIDPRNSNIYANMGVAYEQLGQNRKAIEALSQAVNLDPGNVDARLNLASMYAAMNRHNEAINQFKQVISLDGSNPVALTNLAKLLVGKKQLTEAKHYLREAIAYEPNNADAHWELANIYWKQDKNYKDAEKEYRIAIRIEPTSQVYYNNLGLMLEEQKKKDEAIKVYEDYLVYLNDAFRKEKIQQRIDLLRNPDLAKGEGKRAGGSVAGFDGKSKEDIKRLKKELGGEEPEEAKTMDVGEVDVMGDFETFTTDDDDAAATFDLKEAAKNRAKEK